MLGIATWWSHTVLNECFEIVYSTVKHYSFQPRLNSVKFQSEMSEDRKSTFCYDTWSNDDVFENS